MNNYIPIIKILLKAVAGMSTSSLIGKIAGKVISPDDKLTRKLGISIGALIVSEMVSEKACEFVEKKFDETYDAFKNMTPATETTEEAE